MGWQHEQVSCKIHSIQEKIETGMFWRLMMFTSKLLPPTRNNKAFGSKMTSKLEHILGTEVILSYAKIASIACKRRA